MTACCPGTALQNGRDATQTTEDKNSLTLLKIRTDGGHSAGMTLEQRYADVAGVRAFLVKTLGPIDQQAYKATLVQRKKPVIKWFKRKFG